MIAQRRRIDEKHPEGKPLWAHRLRFMAIKVPELVNASAMQIIVMFRRVQEWPLDLDGCAPSPPLDHVSTETYVALIIERFLLVLEA